jgi:hypothetical protein
MQPPIWKNCTEEELWHYVAWHLEGEGIHSDSVKDRLAGYIHWKSRANFDQAMLICRRQKQRVDLGVVRHWCQREGGMDAFEELVSSLADESSIS